jgi:type I restriction enzyme, R subunit
MLVSPNFGFLEIHDPQLVRLGALAERYFTDDPNTCLIKLRQFGELLAQMLAARVGMYDYDERQIDLMRRLRDRGILKGKVYDLFNKLRLAGNEATHALAADQRTALSNLKYAHQLGIWFHRIATKNPDFNPGSFVPPQNPAVEIQVITKNPDFNPGSFIPPQNPAVETQALEQELAQLRAELQASRTAAELAQIAAEQEAQCRISAEELAKEAEAEKQAALNHLARMQTTAESQSAQTIQETIQLSQQVGENIDLDERETRRLIDAQLRAAGWEVDSEQLTYSKGSRPQKGKNYAIAEFPTANGRADYVLFVGLQVMAVVEAKRQSTDVYAAIDQAKRYSRGYKIQGDEILPGGPWGEYLVPFV